MYCLAVSFLDALYFGATTALNQISVFNEHSKCFFLKTDQTSFPLDSQKAKGEVVQTTYKAAGILGTMPSLKPLCIYNSRLHSTQITAW